MDSLLDQIDRKIESAKSKFLPVFGKGAEEAPINVVSFPTVDDKLTIKQEQSGKGSIKTPATLDTSAGNKRGKAKDMAFTPTQFRPTSETQAKVDEQGNRASILPNSARPDSLQRKDANVKISEPSFRATEDPVKKPRSANKASVKKASKQEAPESKSIERPVQQRQNFVKLNMNRNY
jgi:hypothetical protein